MPSKWLNTTLGEFCPLTYGKGLPERARDSSGTVRVYGSNGVIGYHSRPYVNEPGVVVGRKGTVGAVHYSSHPFWPIDTTFYVTGGPMRDIRFTYYLLRSLPLEHLNSDSAVPGLNRGAAHSIKIRVPDIFTQRRIAAILGALDDKIELNRRMNRTLERMAQALFKSWFIDFDPVRAKAEGDPTAGGLPKDIAALFPDRLVDSELGQIPQGWEAGTLGDIIQILDSKRIPLSSRQRAERQGPYPYYGAAGILDHVDDFLFSGVHVLMGEDGSVVNDDGTPIVQYVWDHFWVNNHAHVLKAIEGVSNEHLYLFLRQVNIRPFVTGAVQPKLNQRNMKAVPFVKPARPVSEAFGELLEPMFQKFRANADQGRTLADLRDTLLPKLLSGELEVPVAEAAAEEVV